MQVNQLTELLEPAVKALGFELWGLEYLASGRHGLLRVYIDHENGIKIEDCEKVSRQISAVLEVEQPNSQNYTLEVSSPGMDRQLFKQDQYLAYCGEGVSLKLFSLVNNQKKMRAVLTEVGEENIVVNLEGQVLTVAFSNIQKAHIIPMFKNK